jgi:hypothetical protein
MGEKQKAESRKQKLTDSAEGFLLFLSAVNHGGENRDQLGAFSFQRQSEWGKDATLLAEKFKPELAFIGLLEGTTELGYELLI